MTDNAPGIQAKATAPGTVPAYRAHAQMQLPGMEFRSVGDVTKDGDYTSGTGASGQVARGSLQSMTSDERQLGRQWMRRIMKQHFGRSNMSGLY